MTSVQAVMGPDGLKRLVVVRDPPRSTPAAAGVAAAADAERRWASFRAWIDGLRARAGASPVARLVPEPDDDRTPTGAVLKARRLAAGLSQRELAAATGLSRGLIAEIEAGRRRHVLTRLRMAEALAAAEADPQRSRNPMAGMQGGSVGWSARWRR